MFLRSCSRHVLLAAAGLLAATGAEAQRTQKPVLHGKDWMAITGKPWGPPPAP